jgi:hypothetical protein
MDAREERLARNELLFRDLNEQRVNRGTPGISARTGLAEVRGGVLGCGAITPDETAHALTVRE